MKINKWQSLLFIAITALFAIAGCSNPSVDPLQYEKPFGLMQGQTLSWVEEMIDSVALPQELYGASAAERKAFINKNVSRWQVNVTIPDSNIKHFRIEKILLQIADRDTLVSPDAQIWRTVMYGNSYSEYNKYNNLIRTSTLDGTDTADIHSLPLIYTSSTSLTDSMVQIGISSMQNAGYSITQNATTVTATKSESEYGATWQMESVFDKTYFGIQSSIMRRNGTIWSGESITYNNFGDYRIATSIITVSPMTLDTEGGSLLDQEVPGMVPSYRRNITQVRIVNLSDITLP